MNNKTAKLLRRTGVEKTVWRVAGSHRAKARLGRELRSFARDLRALPKQERAAVTKARREFREHAVAGWRQIRQEVLARVKKPLARRLARSGNDTAAQRRAARAARLQA